MMLQQAPAGIMPKEIVIDGKTFVLTKFDSISGREIMAKYPTSMIPKIGDYAVSEETMLKLMTFVQAKTDGGYINLRTKDLVLNHTQTEFPWETLARIEKEMIVYNFSFFQQGGALTFLSDIKAKLPTLITKILTDSLRQLSQKEKPASTT